jgi:hypothetical protein
MSRARTTDNIFAEGTFVYAKEHPQVKLVIRRYLDDIYYCNVVSDPSLHERVYFEREISATDPFA